MFNVGASSGFNRLADLSFTRRIGLNNGQPVPIVGGARISGKVDRHNIAAMNITTGALGNPGENFFVGGYSRDILSRSKVGGIIIDKNAVDDAHFNRTFAADTTLALHRNFVVNGFLAKTETPGRAGEDMAGYARATWLSPSWSVYGEYIDLQENFNAEVGFIPRVGIRTSKFHGEWDPRPGRWGIRMFDPMWNMTYTTDQNNRLLTRRIHHMIGTYFDNGSSFTLWSRLRNSWGWRLGAVLNSPGKHPFALDRRLDAGSGGPAARREVEVGLFRRVADRASEHRWVTDAGRAPRGVAGGALVMSPGVRAGRR